MQNIDEVLLSEYLAKLKWHIAHDNKTMTIKVEDFYKIVKELIYLNEKNKEDEEEND